LTLFALAAALLAVVGQFPAAAQPAPQALELRNLTLQARLQLVGRNTLIRGFYSNKSVPLIVDDINRMMVRQVMPPGSYILLSGAMPANIRHGDRVEVPGVVVRPGAADPAYVRGEETILRTRAGATRVLTGSALAPVRVATLSNQQLQAIAAKIKIKPGVFTMKSYAVLINGGWDAANNWNSFQNDVQVDCNILKGKGYAPANITILNADGTKPVGASDGAVNYSASAAHFRTVFQGLATKMVANDTLYVMITDHGSRAYNAASSQPGHIDSWVCLWNHEKIAQTEFGQLIAGITKYSKMTFSLDLCFSGGLIDSLRGTSRLCFAACDKDKSAYDVSSSIHYGALNYAFCTALTGTKPDGSGTVNADTSGDGAVSLAEVFNYVRAHIVASETPHYDDNGAAPDTTLALPQGTEGVLGAASFL
jgi:hypothetical protein